MDTTETITHLSLCSGYEGIGLGLRRVLPNLREIAYVEREGFPVANLVAKMEAGELDAAPVFTDVKTFPYGKFRGCVDILSGGFPCQPFSSAGKRKATDDPRHLFPFIAEGIRECRPTVVFLENVEGIISAKTADGEPVLQYVLRTLEGLGYRATAGIFSASEVGAPHQRKRVFILGYSSHERCEQDPSLRSEQQASWTNEVSGESRGELGYSQHDGCVASEKSRETSGSQEEGRVQESQRGSDELAYRNSVRHDGRELSDRDGGWSLPKQAQSRTEQPLVWGETEGCSGESREELAHSNNEGFPGRNEPTEGNPQGWEAQAGQHTPLDAGRDLWVSRPNEPQYEWEQPRVIESQLGGATDGASSRVDRLRLLGNGVVPATAAKAFVTLIQRLV